MAAAAAHTLSVLAQPLQHQLVSTGSGGLRSTLCMLSNYRFAKTLAIHDLQSF
jgi:hypothetical protein